MNFGCPLGPDHHNLQALKEARRVAVGARLATATKVDVSKVNTAEFTDKYFAKPTTKSAKKSEAAFFEKEGAKKYKPNAEKLAQQKPVDQALSAAVKAVRTAEAAKRAAKDMRGEPYVDTMPILLT